MNRTSWPPEQAAARAGNHDPGTRVSGFQQPAGTFRDFPVSRSVGGGGLYLEHQRR